MPKAKTNKTAVNKAKKDILSGKSMKCECGCGEIVNPGKRFKQGHDAKLKSILLKAAKGSAKNDAAKAKRSLKALGWA
jgi:hypothetical protein